MGIGGINNYNYYNTYRAESIKQVDVTEVLKQDEQKKAAETQNFSLPATVEEFDRQHHIASLEDISLSLNAGDSQNFIGTKSDISLLDMDRVLSDVKKESVLDQYRFFVDTEKFANGMATEDGVVIPK
ncbi:MAG: hypothetical protein K6G07_00380 [Lachnospiraceae bacterium]|nr:hypothetical protein [Lachnospiraceae bacterium]